METHVRKLLRPRVEQISNLAEPFGKPSDASKKKIESGSITLRDGVIFRIEDADREFVFAISDAFQIDQVEALVLLRSFVYNESLPPDASAVDALVDVFTDLYYAERLALLRVLIPLYRAKDQPEEPASEVAEEILPLLVPSGPTFVESLLAEYKRKASESIPVRFSSDPRAGSR
jgi:nuclear pore complex protein Nup188